MKKQLSTYLNRYATFSDEEIQLILDKSNICNYQKKDFLLNQGSICAYNFFILKGLVRQYSIETNGHEKIHSFGIENWWITNLDSFINQKPATNAIQALEKTIVLQISHKDLNQLYITIPNLNIAFRKIYENMLVALQRKDEIHMRSNSRERYYNMVDNIPNFSQRVPQYMIASYLDITPEYLSEIRKKK